MKQFGPGQPTARNFTGWSPLSANLEPNDRGETRRNDRDRYCPVEVSCLDEWFGE